MEFIKFFRNSLNVKNYLENISEVNKKIDIGDCQNKTSIDFKELKKYAYDLRINNVRNYLVVKSRRTKKRIKNYYFPLMLIGLNIISWHLPETFDHQVNLKKYAYETISIDKNEEIAYSNSEIYDSIINWNAIDDQAIIEDLFLKNQIVYTISNGANGVRAYLKLNEDGKIIYQNIETGFFTNLNRATKDNLDVENKEVYINLFDDIYAYLVNHSSISKSIKEEIEELNDNEKVQIVLDIVNYHYLGKEKVDVRTNTFVIKVIISIISFILYLIFKDKYRNLKYSDRLVFHDGELFIETDVDELIAFVSFRYKRAFIEAEKQRIRKVNYLCEKEGIMTKDNMILNEMEKKLLLK